MNERGYVAASFRPYSTFVWNSLLEEALMSTQ